MTLALHVLALALASLLLLGALFFTAVPVFPGKLLLIGGVLVYGWLASFDPFSPAFWIGQGVLLGIGLLVDIIAQTVGIKKKGGSKAGMIGATLGMIVLPFLIAPLGFGALLFGPLFGAVLGAMLGEIWMRRRAMEVAQVGWGSALSFFLGTFFKLLLVALQIGWFYWLVL